MYLNWSKLLSARLTHSGRIPVMFINPRITTHPLQTGYQDTKTVDFLMKAYNAERNLENFEYLLDNSVYDHRLRTVVERRRDFNLRLRESVKAELEKLTRFGITNDDYMHIEACTNALYLMAIHDIVNLEATDYLIARIESKGLENCSLHNLGDLLYYFKKTNTHSIVQHRVLELARKRLEDVNQTLFVNENGGALFYYEKSENQGMSQLEKAFASNGKWAAFRFRFLLNPLAIANNYIFSNYRQVVPFWEPVSLTQEKRRFAELIEKDKKQIKA